MAGRISEAVADTLIEYESAQEDEDVLTGHLGSKLTTRRRVVMVEDAEVPGPWAWSLQYRKFRGRGPNATEKRLGADGIFELMLERPGRTETKSLLFQSKMAGSGGTDLVEQCARLSTWREAAVVLSYSPDGIGAVSIDSALAARGALHRAVSTPLDAYLADLFIPCRVGDNDLRYFAQSRTLVWRTNTGEIVATRFPIKHRFRIEVKPPGQRERMPFIDREIPVSDIHKYRMEVRPDELLATNPGEPPANPKSAVRALSKIYHPDLFGAFSPEIRETVKVRMQEFNEAWQTLKPDGRK